MHLYKGLLYTCTWSVFSVVVQSWTVFTVGYLKGFCMAFTNRVEALKFKRTQHTYYVQMCLHVCILHIQYKVQYTSSAWITNMLSAFFESIEKNTIQSLTIVKNQVSVHVQMEICTYFSCNFHHQCMPLSRKCNITAKTQNCQKCT